MANKTWVYVGISLEHAEKADKLTEVAKRRGIYRSRADIVAEALAEYYEKPEIALQIKS